MNSITPSRETRLFLKLNEQLGRHSLSQEINYTNANVRNFSSLSAGNSTPSTRTDRGARNLLLAFADTSLLGDQGDPWILTLRAAYRGEPSDVLPAHPESGGGNLLTAYPVPVNAALQVPGPLPTVSFGNSLTRSFLDQKYTSLAVNANKRFSDHDIKFGWNFLSTNVDGLEPRTLQQQLYTTIPDFSTFGPLNSGISLLAQSAGKTPVDDELHLQNYYNALFVQDDWKIRNNLTLNLGVRWEHDSEFEAKKNFAPRLGVAWGITPKTVVRAQLGIFYDQFRLGIARGVPQFGGANQVTDQVLLFPRGLYGSPNYISSVALLLLGSGPCFSNFSGPGGNNLTDAQITAAGLTCPLRPTQAFIGVDRLNRVVTPGHAPIPANVPINIGNIQSLSGFSPDQYLTAANAAIGYPGFFFWGPFGQLTNQIIPPFGAPDSLENIDQTPNTLGFSVGVQQEIAKDMVIEANYHHRKIRNLLGPRLSNLAYRARVAGQTRSFDAPGTAVISFGPYAEGKYDGLVLSVNKRFSNRYLLGANYTFAKATDNSRGADAFPSDSFIGTVPVVTEASTGKTNSNGSFVSTNGNFVAQAGTFWNGPDLDKGPSSLAVDHIFQINGMVSLPWQFQISGIFRAQSGFHHSKQWAATTQTPLIDPDGDGNTNGTDVRNFKRNEFTSPPFANLDLRFTKRLDIGERVKVDLFYEMFNVFNRQNPASINTQPAANLFGTIQQVLPGREGQVGLRIEF